MGWNYYAHPLLRELGATSSVESPWASVDSGSEPVAVCTSERCCPDDWRRHGEVQRSTRKYAALIGDTECPDCGDRLSWRD